MNEIDKQLALAQWQTCVEMANAVSQRRDATNNLFVTLHLAVVGLNRHAAAPQGQGHPLAFHPCNPLGKFASVPVEQCFWR